MHRARLWFIGLKSLSSFRMRCMVEPFFRRPLGRDATEARPQIDSGDGRHRYDPNQPRVPAGHSDGGQWTNKIGESAGPTPLTEKQRSLDEVISDAIDDAIVGARYAAARRPQAPIFINGRPVPPTLGQLGRLETAETAAQNAIARVREHDPNWRPRPSAYSTIEGFISARRADAQQARERFDELQYNGIIPGPYFREGIPARGPERNFRREEHDRVNELLARHGCHTCGTRVSGTPSGRAVLDHQPPTRYNPLGRRQYLLPQCLACSRRQGGWIKHNRGSQ